MTDDVASGLVAALEQGVELVDRGGFKLDLRQARAKLGAYQLDDPNRFVLLLVEAAHLLAGCRAIEFEFGRRTWVRMLGVALDAEHIHQWFDPLLVGLAGRDADEVRHLRGRQRLAVALNAALELARVTVISTRTAADEHEAVDIVFDGDAPAQTRERPPVGSPMLSLEIEFRAELYQRRAAQRALLRSGARFARLPVLLDGKRIEPELLGAVALADGLGRAGWVPDLLVDGVARMLFVANGVVVESLPHPGRPRGRQQVLGVLAVLDADELERDLSLTKLRRDAAFEQRVAAATDIDRLGHPPLFVPSDAGSELFSAIVMLPFAVMFAAFAKAGLTPLVRPDALESSAQSVGVALFGALSLAMVCIILYQLIRVLGGRLRRRRLRWWGRSRLAVVRATEKVGTFDKVERFRIDVRVERPERGDYDASLTTPLDSGVAKTLRPGARVFVRVDPRNEGLIALDSR